MGAVAAIVGSGLMLATPARAADLVVPLDLVLPNAVAEGDAVELALVSSSELTGETCVVRAVHGGQGAGHPGNDLLVTSGSETVRLVDIEREPGATTEASAPIMLANRISVELVMGPDRHYAGDIDLEFNCGEQIASFRAGPQPDDAGGDVLPLTGGEIALTLASGGAMVAIAVGLLLVSRRPRHAAPRADA